MCDQADSLLGGDGWLSAKTGAVDVFCLEFDKTSDSFSQ